MTAESLFLLALVAGVCLVLVFASMAAGWRLGAGDTRQLRETVRALRGRTHELADALALEQRVVAALGDHLPEETVRAAVDSVTGASEGRHGR